MRTPRHLVTLLLGIWLILFGLLTQHLYPIAFRHSHDVLGVLAIIAGILCVARRSS